MGHREPAIARDVAAVRTLERRTRPTASGNRIRVRLTAEAAQRRFHAGKMVFPEGFAPPTRCFEDSRSSAELREHFGAASGTRTRNSRILSPAPLLIGPGRQESGGSSADMLRMPLTRARSVFETVLARWSSSASVEIGGHDGCCPRYTPLDRRVSLLFLLMTSG